MPRKSNYLTELRAHLARYKKEFLAVPEHGTHSYRGRERSYEHILPRQKQWLNILEPFREELRSFIEENPGLKLHKDFHHLNSSQAFAFNLFYPYFEYGGADNLLRAMGLKAGLSSWRPELVVDVRENTSADVAWMDSEKNWTYCEVKLSEQEFGTAKNDQRHREKLEKIYAPDLYRHFDPAFLTEARFFSRYQIFRNLWLAARESAASVVFLLPRANTKLWPPLNDVLSGLCSSLRSRVHVVAIEDVLAELVEDVQLPARLVSYADLLVQKYVPFGRSHAY